MFLGKVRNHIASIQITYLQIPTSSNKYNILLNKQAWYCSVNVHLLYILCYWIFLKMKKKSP